MRKINFLTIIIILLFLSACTSTSTTGPGLRSSSVPNVTIPVIGMFDDYNEVFKGVIIDTGYGNCVGSDNTPCNLRISNLATRASSKYLIRFRPVYAGSNISIRGLERVSVAPVTVENVEFSGQYSIDVTAKANDVVRRLRAAIPLNSIDDQPESVFHSFQGFCKKLDVDTENNKIFDRC